MNIGKLEEVPLRELWKHEERGFSAWLESNLEILSEAIGFVLSEPQRETDAGGFEVDLVAEDENGDRVIVENPTLPLD
jgi:RecB family endonuclease NucS